MNGRFFRTVLLEALAIAAVGVFLALAANQISPRGLTLTRDYFRSSATNFASVTASNTVLAVATNATPGAPTNSSAAELLHAKGLQTADLATAKSLFEDPRYRQSAYLFVDARDDNHYQQGHIPGSFQLDYYRPDPHLPLVIPMAQVAEKVIIYCNGGNCEDSELAALLLRDAGIPTAKLFVFVGGFREWSAAGLPVETGVRDSGQIRPGGGKP